MDRKNPRVGPEEMLQAQAMLLKTQFERATAARLEAERKAICSGITTSVDTIFRQLCPSVPDAVQTAMNLSARYANESIDLENLPPCHCGGKGEDCKTCDGDGKLNLKAAWLKDCGAAFEFQRDQVIKQRAQAKEIQAKIQEQISSIAPEAGAKVLSLMQVNAAGVPAGGEAHPDPETGSGGADVSAPVVVPIDELKASTL